MIEVKNIQKKFGDKTVIQDVSAVMKAGQCNLIIGSSGSGKTVLMKCMVGLFEPDLGEILYGGQNFTTMSPNERTEIRKEIGMLFQGSALFDSQTVEQNIMFPLSMFTTWTHKRKLDRVNEVLARVNLAEVNRKFPAELSGGMKKRVALASDFGVIGGRASQPVHCVLIAAVSSEQVSQISLAPGRRQHHRCQPGMTLTTTWCWLFGGPGSRA